MSDKKLINVVLAADGDEVIAQGSDLIGPSRSIGHCTMQFSSDGTFEVILEGRVVNREAENNWDEIGTYSDSDDSKIVILLVSLGCEYRARLLSGSVRVLMTA